MEKNALKKVLEIALSNQEVRNRLKNTKSGSSTKYLNYVLPSEWYFSDIPMIIIDGIHGHYKPEDYDKNIYKIIFTQVDLKSDKDIEGNEVMLNTIKRRPVVEVKLDLSQHSVIEVKNTPANVRWGNIPTPLF
jgi:hypothetical protein